MVLHTSFRRGQGILVILNNGDSVVTKFVEKKSGQIKTRDGNFATKELRSVTIYRGTPVRRDETKL